MAYTMRHIPSRVFIHFCSRGCWGCSLRWRWPKVSADVDARGIDVDGMVRQPRRQTAAETESTGRKRRPRPSLPVLTRRQTVNGDGRLRARVGGFLATTGGGNGGVDGLLLGAGDAEDGDGGNNGGSRLEVDGRQRRSGSHQRAASCGLRYKRTGGRGSPRPCGAEGGNGARRRRPERRRDAAGVGGGGGQRGNSREDVARPRRLGDRRGNRRGDPGIIYIGGGGRDPCGFGVSAVGNKGSRVHRDKNGAEIQREFVGGFLVANVEVIEGIPFPRSNDEAEFGGGGGVDVHGHGRTGEAAGGGRRQSRHCSRVGPRRQENEGRGTHRGLRTRKTGAGCGLRKERGD